MTDTDQRIAEIVDAWDEALGAHDLDAAMRLYHDDVVLESPLVRHLLGTPTGVLEGKENLRPFVATVFANQPALRRRHRTGFFTDGVRVTWEYPRETPDGDQMDIVEMMDVRDGLIARHTVYWGWVGVGMLLSGEHGR